MAGFAEFLSLGGAAMGRYALQAAIVFGLLGIAMAVMETRWKKYMPSPTAVGIGMVVPGFVVFTMFIGGLAQVFWKRLHPHSARSLAIPLASGLIAGEAVVAVLIPLLVAIGILSL